MSKKVFEYVVFYAPDKDTADANTELKEFENTILLDGKILAESAESARTTVIRKIDAKYEKVIDKLGVEIRAFR